jgi:hypothetical protein
MHVSNVLNIAVQKKSRGRKGSRGKNTFESQKGSLNNINQEYEKLLKTEITKGLTNAEALIRLERFGPNSKICVQIIFKY